MQNFTGQMRDRLSALMPVEFAAMPAGMERAIAEGAEDRVTDTGKGDAARSLMPAATAARSTAASVGRCRSAVTSGMSPPPVDARHTADRQDSGSSGVRPRDRESPALWTLFC